MSKKAPIQNYGAPGVTATDPNYGKDIQPISAIDTRAGGFQGTPVGNRAGGAAASTAANNFYGQGRGTGLSGPISPFTDVGAPGFDDASKGGGKVGGPRGTPMPGAGGAGGGTDTGGPGSESGPGILEQWFNQRANGIDQGYQYALDRGTRALNNEAAARGGYNSGAALQSIGDFQANMGAQREAQLDALAGGASGEHQRRLEDMFGQGLGLAGGQAGLAGQYDVASGTGQSALNSAILQLMLNKGGVDSKNTQAVLQNLLAGLALL